MSSTISSMASHTATTSLTLINTSYSPALMLAISSISLASATETQLARLSVLSDQMRAAEASLTIISAEGILATATDQSTLSQATKAIYDASLDLQLLDMSSDPIGLKYPGNIFFLAVFGMILTYTLIMLYRSRYHAFNITFILGEACQVMGWLGRVLSIGRGTEFSFALMQYLGLTISPTFLMAGVYFLFAQLVMVHGREFSVLKPMWYSYFFITTDVVSLLIQAGGGAMSAGNSAHTGSIVMLFGIALQVVAMSIFAGFWVEFLIRVYFKPMKNDQLPQPSYFAKKTFGNFMRFLFNVKLIREYRTQYLEPYYNLKFFEIRSRTLFPWFPLAISVAFVLIYVRCVYRVVELAQGFSGYLMSHEEFLFALDASMIMVACLIFVPFHPLWVFGRENKIKLAHIRKNYDDESLEENALFSDIDSPNIRVERKVI